MRTRVIYFLSPGIHIIDPTLNPNFIRELRLSSVLFNPITTPIFNTPFCDFAIYYIVSYRVLR